MEIIRATEHWQQAGAHYVRIQAMARQHHITLRQEFDEHDGPDARYIVIMDDYLPVATGRIYPIDEDSMMIAIEIMKELNKSASEAMKSAGAHAAAAVSESGLLGHLHSILAASGNAAAIEWDAISLYDRVLEHAESGLSVLRARQTARWIDDLVDMPGVSEEQRKVRMNILCDPQTNGGLLIAVPAESADAFAEQFRKLFGRNAAKIGRVTEGEEGRITVR